MYILAPSILSADFWHLGEDIQKARDAGATYLHIDVMDGLFVPSISFGQPVVKAIRPMTDLFFDVHLMVQDPERYVEDFVRAGADSITVHAEACRHLDRTLDMIRQAGLRSGVALNPATPLNFLDYVYPKMDMVLIMTVNPGYGGQVLIPATLDKIRALREIIQKKGLEIDIEVDGGINEETLRAVCEAGANVFVAGSSVFRGDITENTAKLMKILCEIS